MTEKQRETYGTFFEWNKVESAGFRPGAVAVNDETLRDGIQASGIRQPSLSDKLKLVEQAALLGIDAMCIGFPAASSTMYNHVDRIIRFILEHQIDMRIACAGRTLVNDIEPMVRLSQKYGIAIDANLFVGSSPVRQYTENWTVDHIMSFTEKAVRFAGHHDLPVCFITEDTTRSKPEDLTKIYSHAVECGAYRVCMADTVGYAIPAGTARLVKFLKKHLEDKGFHVMYDWHGHNDRGLALANALAALDAGANCVHATALGIGERSGNTSMEQLLVNLKMRGIKEYRLDHLNQYCHTAAKSFGYRIPVNTPVVSSED